MTKNKIFFLRFYKDKNDELSSMTGYGKLI